MSDGRSSASKEGVRNRQNRESSKNEGEDDQNSVKGDGVVGSKASKVKNANDNENKEIDNILSIAVIILLLMYGMDFIIAILQSYGWIKKPRSR